MLFYPKEENPPSGKLIIGTRYESWEIELTGCGKESVIIFSKQSLIFENCIIGNSYEQKIILKNIGDVNYPITFKTDGLVKDDITYSPENVVINPYKEKQIIVCYTPTTIESGIVQMKVESPYSTNELSVIINSGTVKLEFNMTELDYGIFEKNSRPIKILKITNKGTMKTAFMIEDQDSNSLVRLSTTKGTINAGSSIEIKVSLINNEVGTVNAKLFVYSDLVTDKYCINIKGVCEESIIDPEEFKLVDLGINPTNLQAIKPLKIRNYGKFPLTYNIDYLYPIKLSKSSGVVGANDEDIVNIIWTPNSSYDLRSTVNMKTNIGNYNILIRGKSAFPEISVSKIYIDYGIRSVGITHKETIELVNNGIVPLKWNAYQIRNNKNFSISKENGSLGINEKEILDIFFKPSSNTKFNSSYIIEFKGRSYKEINMIGIGGVINIDIKPNKFNVG